ncbi:MAG TPA: CHAP domain-containing protein [Candidatus Saccharimonadales bacterium]|nr:CHAP domain-containing protein [Candidatus Saccharimonadales bacterium]
MLKKIMQQAIQFSRRFRLSAMLAVLICFVLGSIPVAHADVFQQQIDSLNAQNTQAQSSLSNLQTQASSYQDAINKLQAQISAAQTAISANQADQVTLQQEIAADQAKIVQQKQLLSQEIEAMYVNGQMTTVEMLATSNNLSSFVDAETYRGAVQAKLQSLLTQIAQFENELESQKAQLQQALQTQQAQEEQLSSEEAQQNQLLNMNQNQQASFNQQIQTNNTQIATLKAEQIAANRRLLSTGHVDFSGTCGGSYPATAAGPAGTWGCSYSLDNTIDNWGMYNRECVSYAAWMVYKTYGYMPYWGGNGNANQWPADARAAGIPTGTEPKVNSVAIYMGGSSDPWGHAMWVKSVNGDGTITVDQYNLYYDGKFYETTISASGLIYIYFGG